VTLRRVTHTESAICGSVVVENSANVAVAAVRFAAYAHPRRGSQEPTEEALRMSEWIPIDAAPGATASIEVGLMTRDDVLRIAGPDAQVGCALTEIRYANDATWSTSPLVAFAPRHPDIPRALIGAPAPSETPFCKDDEGHDYSHGAIVRVALEPGTFATCDNGQWTEGRRSVGPPAR
jgi:hypothetical protein